MSKKDNISIIAVSDIKIRATVNALVNSSIFLNPSKTILFTSKKIILKKEEDNIIDIIKINPINSLEEYSNFIIYSLYKYIKTSHILIVQWDGYIINHKKWNIKFLKYDYIGAPFIPRSQDFKYCRDKNGAFYTVGNGGFSLRSKRLLEAPSKFKLVDNKKFTSGHEDGFFSIYHRNFLESKGYSWAPFEIAQDFSIESPLCIEELKDLPLGFHGKKMLYFLLIMKLKKVFKI